MSAKLKFTRNPYGLTTLELRSTRARQRGISIDQGPLFDDPRAKLGYEIRMKRLRMGLTQKELASRLNISRPHLSAMEQGHFTPRAKTWSAVSQFLKEATPGFDD